MPESLATATTECNPKGDEGGGGRPQVGQHMKLKNEKGAQDLDGLDDEGY